MKMVVLEAGIHPDGVALLKGKVEILGPGLDHAEIVGLMRQGAQGLITSSALRVTAEIMANSPMLEVVGRPGIGVDTVDLAGATANGVLVVNTPDGPTESTAEHAVALLLGLAKTIRAGDIHIRASGFANKGSLMGVEVLGKTLGIVGLGRIGKRVAEICGKGLGMRIIGFDPFVGPDQVAALGVEMRANLDELLGEADFVSLHTPLIPETRGMIGKSALAVLKPTAFLINVARGPIVDEDALVEALREGRIAGAGLDVFSVEPIPYPHPLLALENVILTPHIASTTVDGRRKMAVAVAEQVLLALTGQRPQFLANPQVWKDNPRSLRASA